MKYVFVLSRGREGHRHDYNAVFLERMSKAGIAPVLIHSYPSLRTIGRSVVFTMIEEDVIGFIISVAAGFFSRQPVVGLLFRPAECFQKRWVGRIKRVIFKALRLLSWVRVVTILPFAIDARFSEVADDWIYDPQMWDAAEILPSPSSDTTSLQGRIQTAAAGRRIVVALGSQNRLKGFDYFCKIWSSSALLQQKYLFIAAGRVGSQSKDYMERFELDGGMLIDDFIDNQKMRDLYDIADLVWCCYAPDYNQASGVGGRAFQYGVPLIARKDSYLAKMMRDLNHATIEIEFNQPDAAVLNLIEWRGERTSEKEDKREILESMSSRFGDVIISRL